MPVLRGFRLATGRCIVAFSLCGFAVFGVLPARAANDGASPAVTAPAVPHVPGADPAAAPKLSLTVDPALVDVGGDAAFTLKANKWAGPAAATLTFLSKHHGFTGKMVWTPGCSCFRLNVFVAKRVHPLETARATATVLIGKSKYVLRTSYQIRGLAPNGRTFAPGGTPYLAQWVSNPTPAQNEFVHFCAWTRALDAFPVSGMPVTFVLHYKSRTQKWFAGLTDAQGVRCSSMNIHYAKVGVAVAVDVYAGKLHQRTSFTPRKP